jgi:hypothetical protein
MMMMAMMRAERHDSSESTGNGHTRQAQARSGPACRLTAPYWAFVMPEAVFTHY